MSRMLALVGRKLKSMKLAEKVSNSILDRIASGHYSLGQLLPAEGELADELGVSRLTLRESVKDLAARGVIQVRHGKRHRVAPARQWSVLDPQLAHIRGQLLGESTAWVVQLMEARQIVEVGACELAAERISNQQLQELAEQLEAMVVAHKLENVDASVQADLNFHRTIVAASDNDYLRAAYTPLEQVLQLVRMQTSAHAQVRTDAAYWHEQIYQALLEGSRDKARQAMQEHMLQTLGAIREHLTSQ
ncbi:MAG: FadR/GntR family transcriptional regulator [Rothia sp. (in: high G+C Gram-positive bacteria)]|nr:FadR/GntR family transcriptional regulator [Rothia sp. (in: high G+C Gram-positive bacteria)]